MPPEADDELSIETVLGRDVIVEYNNITQANWDKLSIKPEIGTFNRNSADALFEQYDLGRRKCAGTISYILGGRNVPKVLPKPGDEITGLEFQVAGNGNLLPDDLADPTKYGKCRVISTPYELADAPGTISIDILWGFRR